MSDVRTTETDQLARLLAEESFRHSWDMSDEQKIDGAWVQGLCCECGEFVPYGNEVEHLAAAFASLLGSLSSSAIQCTHWLIGAKVGIPQMYDLRCAREPHDDGKHVCGSTDWTDAAGEHRG